jgi:hypothetical protein
MPQHNPVVKATIAADWLVQTGGLVLAGEHG